MTICDFLMLDIAVVVFLFSGVAIMELFCK